MKKTTLILTALASLTIANTPVNAKLHETFAESVSRYGQPVHLDSNKAEWFIDDDFSILATFDDPNGTCDKIEFNKWNGAFTEHDLQSVIASNVPVGSMYREHPEWVKQAKVPFWCRYWESSTGNETVMYYQRTGDAHTGRDPYVISVWSNGAHERMNAAKAAATPTSAVPTSPL
jgi:hypothetical protein